MGTIKGTKKGSFFWFKPDDPRLIVITDPGHKLYDRRVEQPPSDALIESIAKDGMKQPVEVRKVGDEYQVVFGRKRVQAAIEAALRYPGKKILVKAIPATMTDAEALKDATIENSLRMADSASVRGFNAARLIEAGYDDDELERMFGVSIGTIKDWVSFHESAIEEVKARLDSGEITYTQARKISRKKPDKQTEELASAVRDEKPRTGPKKGPRTPKVRFTATKTPDGVDFALKGLQAFETGDLVLLRDKLRDDIQEEIDRRLMDDGTPGALPLQNPEVPEYGESGADDVEADPRG